MQSDEQKEKRRKKSEMKSRKDIARDLYTLRGLSISEVSDFIGVRKEIISKWCKDEAWKEMSENAESIPKKIFDIYSNILERTYRISREGDFDIDNMSKLITQLEKMQPQKTNGDFTKVTTELATFVQKNMPEHGEVMLTVLQEFSAYKFRHLYQE